MTKSSDFKEKPQWWDGLETERYWLEVTDREDLGNDLRAPLTDDAGQPLWRYLLFKKTKVGDTVYHYDKNASAIVGRSRVSGEPSERNIVWGARGSYARQKNTLPHERPGYYVPLKDYKKLASSVSIEDVENKREELRELVESLKKEWRIKLKEEFGINKKDPPIYFPWELSDKREARPLQGYAFKLPSRVLEIFPQLDDGDEDPTPNPDPIDDGDEDPTPNPAELERRTLLKLKKYQTGRSSKLKPKGQKKPRQADSSPIKQYYRDPLVKAWVLQQSNFRCESCNEKPFQGENGYPFLELHHVKRLADGGSDTPENAVALCPNCHRACHYAKDREDKIERLYETIPRLLRE